jgi:transposase
MPIGMWWDHGVPELESMSREELIVLARRQTEVIARQDVQITALAGQLADLMNKSEAQAEKLAKLEHLLSRNSSNSSRPASKDDEPGGTPPRRERRSKAGQGRKKGKQPGSDGTQLRWRDAPDMQQDRFPQGRCECGGDLAEGLDLGVVDRYQQHEIPLVSVKVTQYDQHAVACGCGRTHTAPRPEGAGVGRIEYGPNLKAFAVYLLVVHFLPIKRCCELLATLTGAAPSPGFVHSMISRAAAVLEVADRHIRTLITLAHAVCVDETPLKVGPATLEQGKKQATKYLLVACTEAYTHYLLGDRSLATFGDFVFHDLHPDAVIVHDRYQNYDSAQLGELTHQLCTAHLLRDLADAGEVYPGALWPEQVAAAVRELIHHTNTARDGGREAISPAALEQLVEQFRQGVLVGLAETVYHGKRPGERKARLLLEVLRDREADVLRFAHDLKVPPTSNQAERDLRPSKIQEKISGRLTDIKRTAERYTIRGVLSTAVKHGRNPFTVIKDALCGSVWLPAPPAPA